MKLIENCDLCECVIVKQEGPALCDTCKLTCKAHARVVRHQKEEDDLNTH